MEMRNGGTEFRKSLLTRKNGRSRNVVKILERNYGKGVDSVLSSSVSRRV